MMITWVKRVGVAVALVGGIVLLWRGVFIVAAAIALTVAGAYVRHVWRQWRAVRQFRAVWQPQGKDLLLVYSNSPHWKRYVEENWLPRWRQRAVVLNWSERRNWQRERGPEVALFRAFAGDREFNPLGIVVPPQGRRALASGARSVITNMAGIGCCEPPKRNSKTVSAALREVASNGGAGLTLGEVRGRAKGLFSPVIQSGGSIVKPLSKPTSQTGTEKRMYRPSGDRSVSTRLADCICAPRAVSGPSTVPKFDTSASYVQIGHHCPFSFVTFHTGRLVHRGFRKGEPAGWETLRRDDAARAFQHAAPRQYCAALCHRDVRLPISFVFVPL